MVHSTLAAASDKVYQLLAHGRWFSPGTPSSTTKTGHHDIPESGIKHNKSIKQGRNHLSVFLFFIYSTIHRLLSVNNFINIYNLTLLGKELSDKTPLKIKKYFN